MAKKHVLLILLKKRKTSAVNVQKILTDWGCLIKTRLGIHDGVLNNCADTGLIILELVGTDKQKQNLAKKLKVLPGVDTKLVELKVK
jgi:hypothetical protein